MHGQPFNGKRRFTAALSSVAFGLSTPAFADADDGLDEAAHEFLFLIEEAYTQEAGEWQFGVAFDHAFEGSVSQYSVEVEYGITERLQLEAELPVTDGEGVYGVGDVEFSVAYALLKESEGASPEFTIAVSAVAPTGDADDGLGTGDWGFEASAQLSKKLRDGLYAHIVGGREWTPNGGADAEHLSEWLFGLGAAAYAGDRFALIAEYLREMEREIEQGVTERAVEEYASAGFGYEVFEDVTVGASGAVGLNDESDDVRLIVKFQAEF